MKPEDFKALREELLKMGWREVNKNLWQHENKAAFGLGCYTTEDAQRLYLDYLKRGK